MPFGWVAGATVVGGALQYKGIKDASKASMQGVNQAAQLEQARYEQNREDLAPWREAGGKALGAMDSMMYGDPAEIEKNFQKTPGYQFRLNEGLRALQRSAGSVTGNTPRSLVDYGQGTASAEFGNRYNRLAGLAGTGQTATQFGAAQGANSAARQGGYMQDAANTRASSYVGRSQIIGSTLGSLASAGAGAFGGNNVGSVSGYNYGDDYGYGGGGFGEGWKF